MKIKFGPTIAVDGKRPEWLRDDDDILRKDAGAGVNPWYETGGPIKAGCLCWGDWVQAIKLSADHWAYKPLDAGLVPWLSGETPDDWDKGPVMLADGSMWDSFSVWWNLEAGNDRRVVGYRKISAQPSPADTVKIARMTEAQLHEAALAVAYEFRGGWRQAHRDLGLIRTATKAETIATKTGLSVKDVEAVLAAAGEGE